MPQVSLREKDSLEFALKKLKRMCEKANIWATVRKKERYEKPTTARKRAKLAAVRRENKKRNIEARERFRSARKSRPSYYGKLQDNAEDAAA